MRSLRISNRRFKEATGWAPRVRNFVEGMALVGTENPPVPTTHVPATVRVGLWAMALFSLLAGIQQQFAPRAFYDDFPGFGMHWVAVDGPYNEHLLRDVGQGNLAIAVVALVALVSGGVWAARATGLAAVVANLPHQLYHQAHVSVLPTVTDQVLQSISLAAVSLAAVALVVLTFRLPAASATAAQIDSPAAAHSRL